MAQTVTLLLFLTGAPTQSERELLAAYAQKQRATFVAPAPTPPPPYPPYTAERVIDIESRLDEARTLASSLDEARALSVLDAVERDLLQHPELPQAGWLMAERHRIAAGVRSGQSDGALEARELLERAHVLEGPRAVAFGELEAQVEPERAGVRVRFVDVGARDVLEIDGVPGGAERTLLPGDHQLRVTRAGALVFASWLPVAAAAGGEFRIGLRPVAACSEEDLMGVDVRGFAARVPAGIRCERWVAVRRAGERLELAACTRDRCGSFVPLRRAVPEERGGFPVWAKLALATAASVGISSLVMWGAGVFDAKQVPPRTEFVYKGIGR